MKIILTESQSDNLIKSILKQYGIKLSFGYKQRSYDGKGQQIDTVYVWFDFPDKYTYQRIVDFKTRGYKVTGIIHQGDFISVIDDFKYLPKDLVNDYFINGAKTYVEKILPFEH